MATNKKQQSISGISW